MEGLDFILLSIFNTNSALNSVYLKPTIDTKQKVHDNHDSKRSRFPTHHPSDWRSGCWAYAVKGKIGAGLLALPTLGYLFVVPSMFEALSGGDEHLKDAIGLLD